MADLSMSPEVRELLGALAGHEAAELLRVRRRDAAAEARAAPGHVSPLATSLASAERRLLEAHREELGRLLYGYALLLDEQDARARACKLYADGDPMPTRHSLDARTKAVLVDGADGEAESLLRRFVGGGEQPTSLAVLAAAARVAPSASIRIVQGTNLLVLADDPDGAERVLRSVLAERPADAVTSYAWEALGLLESNRGDLVSATRNYRTALTADPGRKLPKLTWLRFAFLSAQREETLRAAEVVNAGVAPGDEVVRWYLSRTELGKRTRPDRAATQLGRALGDQLAGLARVIIHGHE